MTSDLFGDILPLAAILTAIFFVPRCEVSHAAPWSCSTNREKRLSFVLCAPIVIAMLRSLALLILLLSLSFQDSTAQSPNKHGWVYSSFPTGFGWVAPRESPGASTLQEVGATEVMVRYSRPAVKGRDLWGGLVPFGEVWRAGANEATVISFSTDVMIGDQPLPSGTYGLFLDVKEDDQWTFIFSNRPHQWGAFTYSEQEDVLRVPATVREIPHQERLLYTFPTVSDSSAQVALNWGEKQASFSIHVDTPMHTKALASSIMDWRAAWFAADYFLNKAQDYEEAARWSGVALALSRSGGTLLMHADVMAAQENYDEAIELAEEAYALRANDRITEKIERWKTARDTR